MVEGGSGMSTVGDTLGSVSGEGLVDGNMVKSCLRASLVGWPCDKEGVVGVGLSSSCLRSSKAAAILPWDDVAGRGNFGGRKTTVSGAIDGRNIDFVVLIMVH